MKISAVDINGRIKEYDAILTYHSEEYNKHYVVYTDNLCLNCGCLVDGNYCSNCGKKHR